MALPELPVNIDPPNPQVDGWKDDDPKGFYASHRGKKSRSVEYMDPTPIVPPQGVARVRET